MMDRRHTSPAPLGSSADVSEVDLQQRLYFLGLSPADAQVLRGLAPAIERFAEPFVAAFYEHLFSFESTAKFLQDPERLVRLKKAQRAYFDSLLAAHWDDAYVAGRHDIGKAHGDVGLPPEFFLGAFNLYIQHTFRGLAAQQGEEASRFAEQILPLVKVILLDIGLTLDAYFFQATEKLRQALEMYWRANDDLRRFAQLTSHDLKTPLATVANLCDEVLDEFGDQMPAEARTLIRSARERTFQNSRLIDELLSSTLSLTGSDVHAEVSSADILHEVVERVRPAALARGVELHVPANLPWVWGNRVRLREAFYNVVSNAIKYMDKSRGHVSITTEARGKQMLFVVADDGPGMPAEELESVFIPFRRLPGHHHVPGTGLGLYFTKQLIEADGGQIWVESKLGAGSQFFVLLPTGPPDKSSDRKSPRN